MPHGMAARIFSSAGLFCRSLSDIKAYVRMHSGDDSQDGDGYVHGKAALAMDELKNILTNIEYRISYDLEKIELNERYTLGSLRAIKQILNNLIDEKISKAELDVNTIAALNLWIVICEIGLNAPLIVRSGKIPDSLLAAIVEIFQVVLKKTVSLQIPQPSDLAEVDYFNRFFD